MESEIDNRHTSSLHQPSNRPPRPPRRQSNRFTTTSTSIARYMNTRNARSQNFTHRRRWANRTNRSSPPPPPAAADASNSSSVNNSTSAAPNVVSCLVKRNEPIINGRDAEFDLDTAEPATLHMIECKRQVIISAYMCALQLMQSDLVFFSTFAKLDNNTCISTPKIFDVNYLFSSDLEQFDLDFSNETSSDIVFLKKGLKAYNYCIALRNSYIICAKRMSDLIKILKNHSIKDNSDEFFENLDTNMLIVNTAAGVFLFTQQFESLTILLQLFKVIRESNFTLVMNLVTILELEDEEAKNKYIGIAHESFLRSLEVYGIVTDHKFLYSPVLKNYPGFCEETGADYNEQSITSCDKVSVIEAQDVVADDEAQFEKNNQSLNTNLYYSTSGCSSEALVKYLGKAREFCKWINVEEFNKLPDDLQKAIKENNKHRPSEFPPKTSHNASDRERESELLHCSPALQLTSDQESKIEDRQKQMESEVLDIINNQNSPVLSNPGFKSNLLADKNEFDSSKMNKNQILAAITDTTSAQNSLTIDSDTESHKENPFKSIDENQIDNYKSMVESKLQEIGVSSQILDPTHTNDHQSVEESSLQDENLETTQMSNIVESQGQPPEMQSKAIKSTSMYMEVNDSRNSFTLTRSFRQKFGKFFKPTTSPAKLKIANIENFAPAPAGSNYDNEDERNAAKKDSTHANGTKPVKKRRMKSLRRLFSARY